MAADEVEQLLFNQWSTSQLAEMDVFHITFSGAWERGSCNALRRCFYFSLLRCIYRINSWYLPNSPLPLVSARTDMFRVKSSLQNWPKTKVTRVANICSLTDFLKTFLVYLPYFLLSSEPMECFLCLISLCFLCRDVSFFCLFSLPSVRSANCYVHTGLSAWLSRKKTTQ